jgi:hypothetical protein
VALTQAQLDEWLSCPLDKLDLPVVIGLGLAPVPRTVTC